MIHVTVNVNFPALDRLVDYLDGIQQGQIDQATAALTALRGRLKTANDRLSTVNQTQER